MRSKIMARGGLVLTAVIAVGAALFSVGQADAGTSRYRCGYPYVCLYKGYLTGSPAGKFQQITPGWQHLTRSRGATSFVNTRRNDVAYIRTSGNQVICVRPGEVGGIFPDAGTAVAVRISSRSRC